MLRFSVFLTLVILCANALPYSKDSGVVILDKKNFAENVFGSEHIWLVEFYAPWCGHCKSLEPEWVKLAKEMKGLIKIGAINCDDEKELAGHFGIKGFPTIKFFPSKPTPASGGKGFEKKPEDYNGPRTAAALAKFALEKLPNFATVVKSTADFDKALENKDLNKVVLFTDKDKTSNLYKGLSVDFHYALELLEVRKSQSELVERYGITKFPTLVVLKTDGSEPVVYSGKLEHTSIHKFLLPFAKQPQQQQKAEEKQPEKEKVPEFVYDVTKEISDQETFDKICGTNKLCLVAFLDPTNTESEEQLKYVQLLKKLQEKHQKIVNFLWLDGLKQSDFVDKFNLNSGFPSVLLLNVKKNAMAPYFGSFTEDSLSEYVERIPSGMKKATTIKQMPKIISSVKDEL